jgi:gliding motility-associated-like protein
LPRFCIKISTLNKPIQSALAKVLLIFGIILLRTLPVIAQLPSANFTSDLQSGCSPVVVKFQDLSTGNPQSWLWDFGNGSTSTLQHPTTTYLNPGTYTVTLTATNANGSNTLRRTSYVTVYSPPVADFRSDTLTGCFPLPVRFTDLSISPGGNRIVAWQWDFGNGVTSTQQHPVITYTTAGSFAVTLKVTDDKGCSKVIGRNAYINVTQGVSASFSTTPSVFCSAPANLRFNNSSTGAGALTYNWDFGDGNTSSLATPSHTYTANGTYNVILTVSSPIGCSDTAMREIQVGGFQPDFIINNNNACPGKPVSFTNSSRPIPANVRWSFGDGATSTQQNPTHAYAAPGTYTVWMYNNYGACRDSISKIVTITEPPVAKFGANTTTGCHPDLTVNFTDSSSGASSWQWDFGDGTTSTAQNPSHTFNGYGNYNVTLIVQNANQCADTIVMSNFIRLGKPQLAIRNLPVSGCVPYVLTPQAVITTTDPVTSVLWDFGDGTTSAVQQPTHTYTQQGTYTVKLFITTASGCTDSLVIDAAVRVGTKPKADFAANPLINCAFQPIQFTDLSSAPVDQWIWSFGDGGGSTQQNPLYAYSSTGTFDVRLIAINNGCPDTITRTNYIRILPPIARFRPNPDCTDRLRFTFTDQSVQPQTWLWDFGDGTTSTEQNPSHRFPALGTYVVRLTVTNGNCTHSTTQIVRPTQLKPDFTASATTTCHSSPVVFTPVDLPAALTSSLTWDFGNGVRITAAGAAPITYSYPSPGNYNVRLITTDINGCRDSITKTTFIRVNGPRAAFTALNRSGCTGTNILFNDQSTTDGQHAIVSWRFDFGDGTTQTFTAPPFQHTYTSTGNFTVRLTVTDASGCSHTTIQPNYILITDPQPGFTGPDTVSCPGGAVRFTNTSVPALAAFIWDFGDGNTSTAFSPTHRYADTGSYTVKLFMTDNARCMDSIVKTNYIRVVRPAASFTTNDSASTCAPLEVQFTNTSKYYSSVLWNFGPGEGVSTLNNPAHFYSKPGTYRVKLTITSPGGCVDSAFTNITVFETINMKIDYGPLQGCNPLTVNLKATAPSSVQSYFWDFGDGNTQTGSDSISHTYTSFGNFLPTVIMLDPPGCAIPVRGIDTIRIRGANVKFGLSDSLICDRGTVRFTDSTTSSEPVTSYAWTFGDGTNSSLQHPVHNYTSPGTYAITLTVRTQSGCINSKTATVRVFESPRISIAGRTRVCVGERLRHAGVIQRTGTPPLSWQWIFPNGNTSNQQFPPDQVYQTPGEQIVMAIARNSNGCTDTAMQIITVIALPKADIPTPIVVLSGGSDTIRATYTEDVIRWSWTPSNSLSCANCPQPVAKPRVTTSYEVAFSNADNCRNRDTVQVIVRCAEGNFFIPNTFSPNNDGNNDRFYPRGKGLYSVRALRVFNRWGEVVFERQNFQPNDASAGWDGTYKGKRAQPDVYIYQLEFICDNGELIKLSGDIALLL